jgi:acetylornithine deacetylase/succinyl-diaminopimelate desuccinylase-like protein
LPSTKKSALPPVVASPVPKLTVIPAEDLIWEMIRRVDIERALNDLRQFTGEMPLCIDTECRTITDRETGSEGLSRAKEYVYNQLVNLGYSVAIRDWSREGWTDQNIIASKPGLVSPDEEIYFVAHMDGVLPAGVIRSPAADDNASGTVDLLETARILSRYTFNRTLVLLFSTGEEQGVEGVQSYVDQLSQADISAIKYVVNVDMVGYDSDHDGVMQLWAGDHQPSLMFAQKLRDIILSYQLNLVPRVVTGCT